jgi:hypothetical protein
MSTLNPKTSLTPIPLRQLPVPLPDDGPPSSPPLRTLYSLPARRIWKTLSREQQRKVRQTWLHMLEEVTHA